MPKSPHKAKPVQPKRNTTRHDEQRRKYKTKRWERLSKAFRMENPLCVMCKANGKTKEAQNVDHIKPATERPDLFYDWDNLQSLCIPCHNRKRRGERE